MKQNEKKILLNFLKRTKSFFAETSCILKYGFFKYMRKNVREKFLVRSYAFFMCVNLGY